MEEQRYNEFSNALRDSDVLALVKIDHEELQEEEPMVLLLISAKTLESITPGRHMLRRPLLLLGKLICMPTIRFKGAEPDGRYYF